MIVSTIWRFQCDPASDAVDPDVQVFTRDTTEVEGKTFTDNSMEPVIVKLSELAAAYASGSLGELTYSAKTKAKEMKDEANRVG